MPSKATGWIAANPLPASWFVTMAAYWTPARRSPFGASEARDAGLGTFVCEVGDILTVLPLCHTLLMMMSCSALAHSMGIANVKRADLVLLAESNHLACALVSQVTNLPSYTGADLAACALQLAVSARTLLAARPLAGDLPK
jgi:hypothetical protein